MQREWEVGMPSILVAAWNNGRHRSSGAGYGFRIRSAENRDRHFDRRWKEVKIYMPGMEKPISINIDNDSFWESCRELRSVDIGRWLIANSFAPWPKRRPPGFKLIPRKPAVFEMSLDAEWSTRPATAPRRRLEAVDTPRPRIPPRTESRRCVGPAAICGPRREIEE